MRGISHPASFALALALLVVVLGVSYCRRPVVDPVTVTPVPASPTVYVFYPTATPLPDIFTVPPTPVPEVILERTPLPTAPLTPTPTPTVAPSATPVETLPGTRVPVQKGMAPCCPPTT